MREMALHMEILNAVVDKNSVFFAICSVRADTGSFLISFKVKKLCECASFSGSTS
jgi:hypothetical protein